MTCSAKHLSPQDLGSEDPKGDAGQGIRSRGLTLLRTSLTIVAVGVLALTPQLAFAQHGGGGSHGGGGGAHSSGGGGSQSGGGSSHASGGSIGSSSSQAPRVSAWSRVFHPGPSSAAENHGEAATSSRAPAASSTPGAAPHTSVHLGVAEGDSPASTPPNAPVVTNTPRNVTLGFPPVRSVDLTRFARPHTGPMNFSGQGNQIWQEPPKAGGQHPVVTPPNTMPGSMSRPAPQTLHPTVPIVQQTLRAPLSGVRLLGPPPGTRAPGAIQNPRALRQIAGRGIAITMTPTPPHIFPPRRHRPIFPIYPGYPIYGGGIYGFGWGSPFLGFGWSSEPCDPINWLYSWYWAQCNGYYGGYNSYSGVTSYSFESDMESHASEEYDPFTWQSPPATAGNPENGSSGGSQEPETLLYLTDGTVYAVTDYWLADGKLHYSTTYGDENSIDLNQLDLQRTVDVNASRGVSFTLRPRPSSVPESPTSDQNPPPDQAKPQAPTIEPAKPPAASQPYAGPGLQP